MTIYKDQLEAVYRLIEKPERWTQKTWARYESDGDEPASPLNERATCWCIEGAFCKVAGIHPTTLSSLDVRRKLDRALGLSDMQTPVFNDSHTHPEVLALLKSAIERAPVRP